MITDFHAHAFPDALAARAIRTLEAETDKVKARLDGRVASLLVSMDRAGIDRCVLCSIATKPEQFDGIMRWSQSIASARLIPVPSIHPRDPQALRRIAQVAREGFKGIKLHPYYQNFDMDEAVMLPIYRRLCDLNLMCVCHTGFDIAFPRIRHGDPRRIAAIMRQFPELRLITTHLGAWEDWEEVRRHMLGKPIYMETSYTLNVLPRDEARSIILAHPPAYLLFGTDSPWLDQAECLAELKALKLGEELETSMLMRNAEALLTQSGSR